MYYKILILILLILSILSLAIQIFNNKHFHLLKTQWFYSRGLLNDNLKQWELTFGYWNKNTKSYKQAAQNLYDRLFSQMNIKKSSIVVSVGCGMGNELIYLYKKYRPKKIIGIDITFQHVIRGRNIVKKQGLSNKIKIIHGSGTDLNKYIKPNSVTHVYTIEAINNMPSFKDFINGSNNILVKNGILAFCDGFQYKIHRDIISSILTFLIALSWSCHLSNDRTFNDLLEDLHKTGFKTQKVIDISKNVWKGYCDYKIKYYTEDIKNRNSLLYAHIFKWINQYLYYYTQKYDTKYLIYIGKKIN